MPWKALYISNPLRSLALQCGFKGQLSAVASGFWRHCTEADWWCDANSGWKPLELFQDGRARLKTLEISETRKRGETKWKTKPRFWRWVPVQAARLKTRCTFSAAYCRFPDRVPNVTPPFGRWFMKNFTPSKTERNLCIFFFTKQQLLYVKGGNPERDNGRWDWSTVVFVNVRTDWGPGVSGYPTLAGHTAELPPVKAAAGPLADSRRTIPTIEVTGTLIRHRPIIASAYFYPHSQKHHLFFLLHSFPSCTFIAQYWIWTQWLWNKNSSGPVLERTVNH